MFISHKHWSTNNQNLSIANIKNRFGQWVIYYLKKVRHVIPKYKITANIFPILIIFPRISENTSKVYRDVRKVGRATYL